MRLAKMMLIATVAVVLAAGPVWAQPATENPKPMPEKDLGAGVGLTVYSGGFAVIKERRVMDLPKGMGEVKFVGVAKTIDPTSVHFTSLTDPKGVQVLDQNYEYDLVSPEKILEKYLDKEITLVVKGSGTDKATTVKGVLQSYQGNMLTLLIDGNVRLVDRGSIQDLQLGALPGGLLTRPTLVWKTLSDNGGKQLVKVAYMANSLGWQADYTAVLNGDDTKVDANGWVTISNNSGARYENAQLKLIAGDVRRVTPQPVYERREYARKAAAAAPGGFEEKSFAEYHMYTLPRPTTINDNQVKQIELIEPVLGVPVTKFYEHTPYQGATKVNVKVEFDNKKENGLGIALPKGKVRVFKKDDADGSLEFVGEDQIDHTPKDEKITLYIGDAFDIVAETKQVKAESGQRWSRQGFEVELRNHKDVDIEVRVMVRVGANCRVEAEALDGKPAEHTNKDAFTLKYLVPVKANAKSKLAYTLFYTY
ncbi:MAG: hypothetical protein BIFFINMI_04109 [Phycisphaerae bacterium]|nr:hypothetical protein [Phycisphaerae bacterium]